MRLTYKTDNGAYTGMSNQIPVRKALEKLSRLEDVEEELGIDLITLLKALKNSMWFKHYDEKYNETWIWDAHCYKKPLLNVYNKTIEIKRYVDNAGGYWYVDEDVVYLKDYGKTWALTKEELL